MLSIPMPAMQCTKLKKNGKKTNPASVNFNAFFTILSQNDYVYEA